MWRVACIALAFALISQASAQDAPRLLNVLDEQTRNDAFPPVALARGVSGNAMLSCNVAADATAQCTAAEETPTGMGFGAAAESLAAQLQFAPVAGTVMVPVLFTNENTEARVIEATVAVDGGTHIDLDLANTGYAQLMATYHALAVCNWSQRPDCGRVDTGNSRAYNNVTHFPQSAIAAGVGARALVACAVRSDRRIECALEGVTSAEHGFGDAAVRLVNSIASAQSAQFEAGQAFRVPVSFNFMPPGSSTPTTFAIWERSPTAAEFMRFYPQNAMERGRSGGAVLSCAIREDRELDCTVLHQTAREFGNAALRIGDSFRLTESAFGQLGYAIGDRIKIPINFRVG
jgi:hypothetical protein